MRPVLRWLFSAKKDGFLQSKGRPKHHRFPQRYSCARHEEGIITALRQNIEHCPAETLSAVDMRAFTQLNSGKNGSLVCVPRGQYNISERWVAGNSSACEHEKPDFQQKQWEKTRLRELDPRLSPLLPDPDI